MPARRKRGSPIRKPAGSMIAASTPRQAQVRIIAPAFWAMSGSNRARRSGAGGPAHRVARPPSGRNEREFGARERKARTRRKAKGGRGLVLWTSNSINAKSRLNCRPAWLCAERKAPTEFAVFIRGLSCRATPPMNP